MPYDKNSQTSIWYSFSSNIEDRFNSEEQPTSPWTYTPTKVELTGYFEPWV